MTPFIDPRNGDFESDALSSKSRSMMSIAGSLIAEISLPKLVVAWFVLIGFPALALGSLPILASIWFDVVVVQFGALAYGLVPAFLLVAALIVGFFGARRLWRLAERSFWSLNALAVQPGYAVCREILNQAGDRLLPIGASEKRRASWRSITAILSGAILCLLSIAIVWLVFPWVRISADLSMLQAPVALAKAAIANSIAIVAVYVAVASLIWAFADATMVPTHTFPGFGDEATEFRRKWRVAHLSDIHAVGEAYGFRIESGRSGPRGNDRLVLALKELERVHRDDPLHAILVTGDITDAGLATEWAEFLNAVEAFPELARLMLLIPGNHDVNIANRANPAQFDLPTSPFKKLRKLRVLSTLNAIQGARVHVVDKGRSRLGQTLQAALQPQLQKAAAFANTARPRLYAELDDLWSSVFPMVLPPDRDDGLGIVLMNSNADAHFSFTNALGMISVEQYNAAASAFAQYPHAVWVVCIHHHLVEYPRAATALSERIGTALVNGQWFVRRLQAYSDRIVVMHGHRHVDWFGRCGPLTILSAPSTVMGDADDPSAHFYIHTIGVGTDGKLGLLNPQRIVVGE